MNSLIRIRAARRRAAVMAVASFLAMTLLGGCAQSLSSARLDATPEPPVPDAIGSLPAQYAGTLPCGDDCSGIAYWLTLGPHGIYVLQQHYNAELESADYVEVGHWQTVADNSQLALTPADSDETGTSLWAIAGADRLIALDGEGQTIDPVARYTLQRRASVIERALDNTRWYLVNAPDAHHGGDAYIRFNEQEKRLSGSTGCNRLTGTYERRQAMLRFADLGSAGASCQAFEDTEQSMLEALRQTHRVRVLGNYLLLFGAAGDRSPLAIFQAETEAMPLSH